MQIDSQLLQETLDYLQKCPYKDVAGLLSRWAKYSHPVPEKEPEEEE